MLKFLSEHSSSSLLCIRAAKPSRFSRDCTLLQICLGRQRSSTLDKHWFCPVLEWSNMHCEGVLNSR